MFVQPRLFDAGVEVTVNTDDVLVFGNGVSEEFLSLYQAKVFNADELDGIRQAGLTPAVWRLADRQVRGAASTMPGPHGPGAQERESCLRCGQVFAAQLFPVWARATAVSQPPKRRQTIIQATPETDNALIALFQVQFCTETPIPWYHLAPPSQYDGNS